MKQLTIIIAFLVCISLQSANAQIVQSAPKGNFIWCSPELTAIDNATIFRKGATDAEFKKLRETGLPSTIGEIDKRAAEWQKEFSHLPPLTVEEKTSLLDMAKNKTVPKNTALKYHPVAMGILGQAYYDIETPRGIKVSYRISLSGKDKIVEAVIWPAKNELPIAELPEVLESSDRINITWQMKGKAIAEGYRIYRRTAMRGDFVFHNTDGGFSLSKEKWTLIVTDTLVEPLAMYEYKAVSLDKLGNESEMSEITRARTRGENVLPYFTELSAKSNDDGAISLRWKLLMPALARSINVYRSKIFDKDFSLVGRAAIADSLFVDETVEPNENQYYKLEVLMDEGSRTSAVISVLGKNSSTVDPPHVISVTAKKDLVIISWVPDSSTVYGYYVYMQNAIGSPAIQISHLIAPDSGTFSHKAIIVGSNYSYYYSVAAVGFDYKVGERSTPIEVMLHGVSKVKPISGLRGSTQENKAILFWDEQFSRNENVIGYIIYRKEKDKDYVKLVSDTLNPGLGYFEDEKIEAGREYTYKVEVRDYFGASDFAEVKLINELPELVPPGQLTLSSGSDGVFLRWSQTNQSIKAVRIYSFETGQTPKMLVELSGNETTYKDIKAIKGKRITYFIKYVSHAGKESKEGVSRSIMIK